MNSTMSPGYVTASVATEQLLYVFKEPSKPTFETRLWMRQLIKCCYLYCLTWQQPEINAPGEIKTFLKQDPWEIITIIIEDPVETPMLLARLFNISGLKEFWFPVTQMPKNGGHWTWRAEKEASEGIAYQWNYMVANQCKSFLPSFYKIDGSYVPRVIKICSKL